MSTELRLALAMRGGVSLAVWIGGAVSEIDLARRSEGGTGGFWPQLLAMSDYDRVVVDVLAGASAGGLNGVLYAASQVYDFPYNAMRDIWLTVGGTEGLVRREGPWPSLFKGDDYFLTTVHDKLRALAAGRESTADGRAGPARRERVDLALSATVIEPVIRPLPSPVDEQLVERRYGSGFRFRQPEEPWLPTDYPPPHDPAFAQGLWRLAIAARSTSSYPGAFEAAKVRSTRRATFADPPGEGSGAEVDLDGKFLERSSETDFVVADGGILDNIPIQCALDYVAAAPAAGPTERVLVYLQPGAPSEPKTRAAAGDLERRSTVSVGRGVLGARVAGETINDDIAAIEAFNEAVERATTLRSATFTDLVDRSSFLDAARARRSSYNLTRASHEAGGTVALLLDPLAVMGEDQFPVAVAGHPVDDARWRSPVAAWPQAVRESLDPALNRALGTTLAAAPDGRLLTCTGEVAPLLRVTDLLTAWARWVEPQCPAAGGVKGQLYSVRAFLSAILERTRRLAWVAAAARTDADHEAFVDVALPALAGLTMVEPDVAATTVHALESGDPEPLAAACKEAVARIDGVVAGVASQLAAPTAATLAEVRATGTDLLDEIAGLLVTVVAPLAGAPVAPSAGLAAAVAGMPAAPAGELLHRVLGGEPVTVAVLEALDVLCLPEFVSGMPGRRRIDFRRLSSANRTPLAQDFVALLDDAQQTGLWWDPDAGREDQQGIHVMLKLAGNELANFSAFLLAHWRANDWLWGRLDAVPTMVDLLVRPEQLAAEVAAADDPVALVRELVAPTGHPWQADLEVRIWAPYQSKIAAEIDALLAAAPGARERVAITAVRTALVARRQWEILGDEYRLPKSPMGTPPDTDGTAMPTFEQVRTWVAGYRVGAETLRNEAHAPELLDRFDEIATAATEMVLWNTSLPGSRLPRPGRVVGNAIRRLGPRLGRQLARKLVAEKGQARESRTKVAIAFVAAALVVLGVLGWFIDRWAFLLGFGVSFVPLVALGWVAYKRIRRLLDTS